jgi:hypothetical protein
MYWFNYRAIFFSDLEHPHSPKGLRSDMINYLRIFLDRNIHKQWNKNVHFYDATDYSIFNGTWRTTVVDLCHLVPVLFLLIELFVNKIKFPKR